MKGYWETSASNISMNEIDRLLYKNASIDQFLNSTRTCFIIAEKGIGKTLLLKKKKMI
jgi:hypothetical protein